MGGGSVEASGRLLGSGHAEWATAILQGVALTIEMAGVAVIAGGILVAIWIFIQALREGVALAKAYHRLRTSLARGILLGLEFLLAADIISTVTVEPTMDKLWALGLIVLIRTFLSFSLEVEIEGRWPWHKRGPTPDEISHHP